VESFCHYVLGFVYLFTIFFFESLLQHMCFDDTERFDAVSEDVVNSRMFCGASENSDEA
jgi:hypothetical protein